MLHSMSSSPRMSRCPTMPDGRSPRCGRATRACGGTRTAGRMRQTGASTSLRWGKRERRRTGRRRTRDTRTACKVFVLKMDHDGAAWQNVYLDTSAKTTPCTISGCYGDYFAAQAAVGADSAGHLTAAYTLNAADGKPHTLFVRTSADGLSWSDRSSVNDQA